MAQAEWDEAKDEAKRLKGIYDDAVEFMLNTIDDRNPKLPFPEDEPEPAVPLEDEGGKQELAILTLKGLRLPENLAGQDIRGLTPGKIRALEEGCGGSTIADLEAMIAADDEWDEMVKGFNEDWRSRTVDALYVVRRLFPRPAEFELQVASTGEDEESIA